MQVRRFINPGTLACVMLLTMLCSGIAAEENVGSRTVADVVLQIALQSGYTGNNPAEAAHFLAANGILSREAIGDLDRPADEAFFDTLQNAGIPLARCICASTAPPGEPGNVNCWALETATDPELIIAQVTDTYGDAATIFRVPIPEELVDDFTAWCPCCDAMGAFTPQPAPLGLDVVQADITAMFFDFGLDPNAMATCLNTYIPPLRPTGEPGPEPPDSWDQRFADDLQFLELLGSRTDGSPSF